MLLYSLDLICKIYFIFNIHLREKLIPYNFDNYTNMFNIFIEL